jgi:predicted nucleic acid-binding protein
VILVDANVLLDILTNDPDWREWSEARFLDGVEQDRLAINPIIYAEISIGFRSITQLEKVLTDLPLARLPLPYPAAFRAGQAFLRYRKEGGTRRSPLPDFYIGAHAEHENCKLLTRDTARYRTYFPKVTLVAPG